MNHLLRRTAVSAGLAVAAVAIAVPLTTGGSASAATSSFVPVASLDAGQHAPQALRDDLSVAWAAPDGQRVAALNAVLDKAVGGAYGEKVAARAAKVKARLAALPAALRTDVDAAIELPQDQRRAALKEIRAKVRAGDYGDVSHPLRPFRFLHQR